MLLPTNEIFSLLTLFLALAATTIAASLPYSTSIYSWPLTSDAPTLFAEISYDPKTLTTSLDSYHPPKATSSETDDATNLVRIGLHNKDTKGWTGTLTSLSSLLSSSSSPDPSTKNTTLALHLNPTNPTEIYHVSLSPISATTSNTKNADDPIQVSILGPYAGPTPQLSKPVAPRKAGGEGQGEEDEEEEKSLFQRYWWVLLLGAFLVLSGGGEGK